MAIFAPSWKLSSGSALMPVSLTSRFFEARIRFVDVVIASFNHTCPPPSADVAFLDGNTHTLYGGAISTASVRKMAGHLICGPACSLSNTTSASVDLDLDPNDAIGPQEYIQVTGNGSMELFDRGEPFRTSSWKVRHTMTNTPLTQMSTPILPFMAAGQRYHQGKIQRRRFCPEHLGR